MLIEEFIPFIERQTKTGLRALYGWSMGGYGALLQAGLHTDMFRAVVALSPALWTKSGDSAPGAFDDREDFMRNDVFALRSKLSSAATAVRISCGTDDPFYKSTQLFVAQLPNTQIDFGKGIHDAAYWCSVSPVAMQFIATAVGT